MECRIRDVAVTPCANTWLALSILSYRGMVLGKETSTAAGHVPLESSRNYLFLAAASHASGRADAPCSKPAPHVPVTF